MDFLIRIVTAGRRWAARDIPSFNRYVLVGLVNSVVGYGVIFGLLSLGANPYLSNASGYAVGITVSYILNKRFSFRSRKPDRTAFPLFVASLAVAYLANLAVLFALLRWGAVNPYLAQLLAGGVYTLVGFLGSRYIAFGSKHVQNAP
ncbi:MAG: GtrA family protein [Desulfosoma sp.]